MRGNSAEEQDSSSLAVPGWFDLSTSLCSGYSSMFERELILLVRGDLKYLHRCSS